MVRVDAGWNDIGSYESLLESLAQDATANTSRADVLNYETTSSFVFAESRLVATVWG